MKKIFYEKVGRRYIPISEYDSEFVDAFSKGTHLVMSYPGGQSRMYNINPTFAPMIAAARHAREAMSKAMRIASELKPKRAPITPKQKIAWDNLAKAFDDDLYTLQGPSAYEVTEAGIAALIEEANLLLTNPAVKKAYEHFLLVSELTREHEIT